MTAPSAPVKRARTDQAHSCSAPHVGEILVTKGRHAGKRLSECPVDYLTWLVANSTCSTYRLAAAELLGIKADPSEPPKKSRAAGRDRDGGKPTVLTDDNVNEILGVLFKLADELDRLTELLAEERRERVEQVAAILTRLSRAEVALEHLGFDVDAPEPEFAGVY